MIGNMNMKPMSLFVALLLVGSATFRAQDIEDPFPDVDYNQYADNMTFFGQVMMGGEIQPDGVIVAVYCGDEIRGKGVTKKQGKHEHCAKFNITGETKNQPLHFKVFIGGRIIEVDQGEKFVNNTKLGSTTDYYYVNLPLPVVTTPSNEGWSTTCVPFNAEIPDGVTVYAATGVEEGRLQVTQLEGKILPANTPVLVGTSVDGNFEWLSRVATADKPETNIFKGTTEATPVEANSVFTLGHDKVTGEIGFWRYTGTTIPANRAYLDNIPSDVKGITFLNDEDGVETVNSEQFTVNTGAWYDLSGREVRRASNRTLQRGIYVREGKKFVVK